jgi:hypothetical protein
VYDVNAPVNEKAYFKVRGIRQFNTDTAPVFGGVPTGMKAKYDLLVRANEDVERNRASPAKIYTFQQQDAVLLGEQILRRAAYREMQTYEDLVGQGLTPEEATKVVRDQMIAKVVSGKGTSTRAYHQQLKEVVHQIAAERGVQVGLPQSLATFAGKFAPNANFATTGIGAVKAELRQKIYQPLFNVSKTAAQLDQERLVDAAAGVRQVPDRNGLPPADAFAHLPREAMQMRMPLRPMATRLTQMTEEVPARVGHIAKSRISRIEEATGATPAGVSEGRQGAFSGSPGSYDLDSLRQRAREMGVSPSGTAAQIIARLNAALAGAGAGGGGEIAQPIAEGKASKKK